ncbi:hypothetical protein ACFRKB_08610 [Streptomyces scopuliridis]|uniref:hypothetical protein n=1 Tax=Streptomyces scopuliridis TaxID=452529 RepID=UPI003693CC4D
MASLTFMDVAEVDLGKLGSAVSDWKTAVGNLKTLAGNAKSGLLAKSDSARWAGVNATVTREFVGKTVKEFTDAHAQAESIWKLLDDAHSELLKIQKSMKTAVEVDAPAMGVRIEDIGGGAVRWFFPHVRGDTDERTQEQRDAAQALADRIAGLIAHATEIDSSVTRALGKAHGGDVHNFGHSNYTSLDDAQVERQLELAALGPKMTDAQLAEFNSHMKYNAKDPDFTTAFYQGLGGPEATLEFYGRMSIDGTGGDDKARLALTQELQRTMGTALATATDPDNKPHLPASWGAEFRKLGTQPIELEPGAMNSPYGYQVLGGLLRYGDYDPEFLNPIAEHVTQLHRDDPTRFMLNAPMGSDDIYGFNPSGKLGSGNDPLNSVLEALGHSPEASEKFFSDTPTKYNEDGTVDKNNSAGFSSYLEEFTKEDFQWNIDTNAANVMADEENTADALNDGPNALGHALEAATTGRPYDSDDTADAIPHSEKAAALTSQIVELFGENPGLLQHNENGDLEDAETGPLYAMRDSLGDITAEYMGDFQRVVYAESGDDFPTFGAPASLDMDQARSFLSVVGQDPDAYAAITSSQQAYTSQQVDAAINTPTQSEASIDGRVRGAVAPGAVIAGIMSESRADAVIDYHSASDQEFNDAAADNAKWVNRIVGMGTGAVGERVPIAGELLGWVSEDITESVLKSIEQDSAAEAQKEAGRSYTGGREAAILSSEDAVNRALMNSDIHVDTYDDLRRAAKTEAGNSHDAGASWQRATDPS